MKVSSLLIVHVLGISSVLAHGHHAPIGNPEISRRAAISNKCAGKAAALNRRRMSRHKEKRSLASRDTVTIDFEDPHYTTIQNDTCVLTAEVTAGPYVWPRSETLRQDMTEDQVGVPIYLDIGVLDTTDCSPLPDVLVELWHCNATGSYSSFEGLSPNTPFPTLLQEMNITDPDNVDLHTGDSTWLRGLWPTDDEGMMEMKTIFPGFYVERTIHIHAQVHTNWTVTTNGTVATSNIVSTGQLFFGEDLSEQIMTLEPYASHTQINRTTNDADTIYPGETANGYNPIMSVAPLDGVDVSNGMIAYITIGVNSSAVETDS